MIFKNFADLSRDVEAWCGILPQNISLVVGVPRSGIIPATMIGQFRHLPVTDLDSFIEGKVWDRHGRRELINITGSVLVVDDSSQSGSTLKKVKEALSDRDSNIKYGVVYAGASGTKGIDYCFQRLPGFRAFQWNVMNSWVLQRACVDIDGVLCENPTKKQYINDGPLYKAFLRDARPRHLPQKNIHHLVTCRLERDRAETEDWLERHGIKYGRLTMMDYPNAVARRAARAYVKYKAKVFKQDKTAKIFIDDNPDIAQGVAKICPGSPALCVSNWRLYEV